MSTYITYRTHTDRASGIDVLTAQLNAKVICTQKLSKDVESLKTENSQMRRLIEEKSHQYNEEVTRLQSEWQRQKYAYEQQTLALQRELAQRSQITSGDQMMNMQSVPTMSHTSYTSYSMQAGSRYTKNSGNGIQQRLIGPTNQRNEPMIHGEPVTNSVHQPQSVVFPSTESTASFYAPQCQMQRINHTTTINTQHVGQSTPYIVSNPSDIAMSVPAQNVRPNMFQSVTENRYLNQSSGNETRPNFPIPSNPQSAQIRHMPIQSIPNRAIPGCYSSSNGGTASFNTPQFTQMRSVHQASTTGSQYDGQQMGGNGMNTCYPNSEY